MQSAPISSASARTSSVGSRATRTPFTDLVWVTQHQADIIPFFCQAKCGDLIKSLKQVFYCDFQHHCAVGLGCVHTIKQKGTPLVQVHRFSWAIQRVFCGYPYEE